MLTMMGITFREGLNRKVLLISLVLAAVFLGLYGTGVHFAAKSFNEHPNPMAAAVVYPQLLSFGLYFGGFIVSFLAIFSAVGTISAEIENGIIQAVITKPISRRDFVLGKFLGLGLFLAVYAAMFYTVISLVFTLQTGLVLEGQWKALALFALQPVVLLAVTLYGSVVMPTIANGVVIFMLYAVAVMGGITMPDQYLLGLLHKYTAKNP
jgi:ABC-type transport system involved in multi-copper enzyme maturation permease subunit